MKPVYIFDNDGTLTTPVPGMEEAFFASYVRGFAEQLGVSESLLAERFAVLRSMIAAHPENYSWVQNGYVVAPANVDVCVEADVIAQIILGELRENIKEWMPKLVALYQANYLKAETVLRAEALEVLSSLRSREIPFYIVTNADPLKVRTRFAALGEAGAWVQPLIHGHAKKYAVTLGGPMVIPDRIGFVGLERAVWIRKQHYYVVLEEILKQHHADWSNLIVVGDIAELDLAMPVTLGARGRLMLGPNTPQYERNWADYEGWRGRVRTVTNLFEAIA